MPRTPAILSIEHQTSATFRPGPPLPSSLAFTGVADPQTRYQLISDQTGEPVTYNSSVDINNDGSWLLSTGDTQAGVTSGGFYNFRFVNLDTGETEASALTLFGTTGADTLSGPVLGATITGPTFLYGQVRNPYDEALGVRSGDDTFIAYTVAPDADGNHARGASISIDGNGPTDTVVLPVSLGDLVSHSTGRTFYSGNIHLTLETADATIQTFGVEKLRFNDVTLTVQRDPLVDFLYYDTRYRDIAAADLNVRAHYDAAGWHEGRDPNAFFSTLGYQSAYADVRAADTNPLTHYDSFGWHEGRDPSASFDTSLYLAFNPDVAKSGMDPLAHYLQFGIEEGRKISPVVASGLVQDGFDPLYYKLANPDVGFSNMDPLAHYEAFGWREGRNPDAFFDTRWYLAHNPDVAAAGIDPLTHYEVFGWHEGRDPSSHFNTQAYLAANPDVAAAGIDPLDHFLQFGVAEGRSAQGDLF